MSRRGSSTEQLQENRKSNLFGNFLNQGNSLLDFMKDKAGDIKDGATNSGFSFKDLLPFPARVNYEVTKGTAGFFKDIFNDKKDGKDGKDEKEDERDYLDENKQLLQEISNLSEKARDKAALRTGISNLALSPLIGGQAAMDAAAEVNRMTIANMGAMAAQNRVLESNPTKQKIAGKYFR